MSVDIEFGFEKQDVNRESLVIKLSSELNSLTDNIPDIDLSNLLSIINEIINEWDITCQDSFNQNIMLENVNSEMSILISKLELEKDLRNKEITKSLEMQDEAFQDNICFQNKIKDLGKKLEDCAVNLRVIENEKALLVESLNIECKKIINVNQENDKLRQKICVLNNKLDILQNDLVARNLEQSWRHDKWVDDSVLSAYFGSMLSSACNRKDILFLGPSETHLLKLSTPETSKEFFPYLRGNEPRFVFCCVNNSTSEASGTHWSLLFCDRILSKAYHFDSLNNCNMTSALMVANNLEIKRDNVLQMSCYQQSNSFECGINVLVNAKHIFHHYCLSCCNLSFEDWFYSYNKDTCTSVNDSNVKHSNVESIPGQTILGKPTYPKIVSKRSNNEWTVQKSKKSKRTNRTSAERMAVVNNELHLKNAFSVLENDASQFSEDKNNSKSKCFHLKRQKATCKQVIKKSTKVRVSEQTLSSKHNLVSSKMYYKTSKKMNI